MKNKCSFPVRNKRLPCNDFVVYIRENVHQVGSILFETNFIITQLAMFDLLLRFEQWPLNIQLPKKAADGGRNVEVSRILLVV